MEVLALQLANAVLEGESPRDFLSRMGPPKRTIRLNWPEWDELDQWHVNAALELSKELEGELEGEEGALLTDMELDDWTPHTMTISLGRQQYLVYEDEDVATREAVAKVEADMYHEPENFNQEFLANYINVDRLRNDLRSDEQSSAQEAFDDQYSDYNEKRDFLIDQGYLEREDFYAFQPDEDGDVVEVELPLEDFEHKIDSAAENYVEKIVDDRLSDPIAYLQEMHGKEEGLKLAMQLGGIDYHAAAETAVRTDGTAHFLASYDDEERELSNGAVYYRVN